MRTSLCRLIRLSLLALLLPGTCFAKIQETALRQRLTEEYPGALEKLERYYTHLRGSFLEEEQHVYNDRVIEKDKPFPAIVGGVGGNPFPQTVIRVSESDFAISGSLAWLKTRRILSKKPLQSAKNKTITYVEITDPAKTLPDRTYCVGENGSFSLTHDRESKAPILKNLRTNDSAAGEFIDENLKIPLFAAFRIRKVRISDLLKDPGTVLGELSKVVENGRKLIKIKFTANYNDKSIFPTRQGWFVVSPDEGWVLKRFELADKTYPRARDCEVTYLPAADASGIPLVATVRQRDPYTTLTTSFANLVHADVPPADFTLSAFGLPDISKPIAESVPGGWARWYYVAAGLAIAGAIGSKVYATRAARRGSAAYPN